MSADRLMRLLAIYAEIGDIAAVADPDTVRLTQLSDEADALVAGLGQVDPVLLGLLGEVEASRATAVAAVQASRQRLGRLATQELRSGNAAQAYATQSQPEARFLDRNS